MRGVKLAHYGACSNRTGVKLFMMKLIFMMMLVISLMMIISITIIIIVIIADVTPSKSA